MPDVPSVFNLREGVAAKMRQARDYLRQGRPDMVEPYEHLAEVFARRLAAMTGEPADAAQQPKADQGEQ